MKRSIWVGFDAREAAAYAVTRETALYHAPCDCEVRGLILDALRAKGLYTRPTSRKDGRLWDEISQAHMSTEFANSRFLVPRLAREGLALFMDGDMLVRESLAPLFDDFDHSKAVMVVKHVHHPRAGLKMDGQIQTAYARKNWSSFMMLNASHPANQRLTVDLVNTATGRDLHRFCWLEDDEIGELGPEWNWLVGHSDRSIKPKVVHFTAGAPFMLGHEDDAFADEWRRELYGWAA